MKNGEAKCEKSEIRVGNFFVKVESQHIKIQDLAKCFTLRYSVRVPVGMWLFHLLGMGEEGLDSLKTYIAVLWSMFSVIPDAEYVQDIIAAANGGLERHPEWYGNGSDGDGD